MNSQLPGKRVADPPSSLAHSEQGTHEEPMREACGLDMVVEGYVETRVTYRITTYFAYMVKACQWDVDWTLISPRAMCASSCEPGRSQNCQLGHDVETLARFSCHPFSTVQEQALLQPLGTIAQETSAFVVETGGRLFEGVAEGMEASG